jgi:hypothetical protein
MPMHLFLKPSPLAIAASVIAGAAIISSVPPHRMGERSGGSARRRPMPCPASISAPRR